MNYQTNLKNNLNINLNNQQLKAVNHTRGNGLVLATAGSGKTTVIISRLGKLLNENNNTSILTITFSKMAALEMEKRFLDKFGYKYKLNAKFSTIHSFAYKLVVKYFRNKNINVDLLKNNYDILNQIVKEVYNKERYQNTNKDEIENISSKISYFKNMLYDPKKYKDYDVKIRKFDVIFNLYEKYKKEKNYIDFDDLLIYAYKILKTSKAHRNRIKNKYDYIQIDEVQDTSKIQHHIINMISKNNLFMVGDDDQSIYSFRGSYPEFLLNFEEEFPEGKIYYLGNNYRSDGNIVETASKVIKYNQNRYDKNINASKGNLYQIKIKTMDSYKNEMDYILENINEGESTGVLYRYNISSIMPSNLLLKKGIDFFIKDSIDSFFNNNIIEDFKSFFKLSADGRDKKAFKRIYYKCNTYFTKEIASFVVNGEGNIYSRLDMYYDTNKRVDSNISRFKEKMIELSKLGIKEGIEFILYELNYIDYLYRLEDNGIIKYSNAKNIIEILKELGSGINKIEEFDIKLKELNRKIKESSKNKDSNVTQTTIHSAKGLEYDTVFLIDNNHGEFPQENLMDENNLEEERRIFYVGMTRAKKNLHIITSRRESLFFNEVKYFINKEGEE